MAGPVPGQRFLALYERRRSHPHGRALRFSVMAAGSLLVALGALLVFTPGPGALILLAGSAMVASESRAAAGALDRIELRLRALLGRVRG